MTARAEHFVSQEPFDPRAGEELTPEQERFYRASQWQIMWWKFRRHRIAVIAGAILLAFYASILVSEILAPYNLHTRDTTHIYAPPQRLHLFHEGSFVGPSTGPRRADVDAGLPAVHHLRAAPCRLASGAGADESCQEQQGEGILPHRSTSSRRYRHD